VTCELIEESGAYVLGILDPDDRVAYERHLETCAICQREVADFGGLPGLLAQLDPAEALAIGDAGGAAEHHERERFSEVVADEDIPPPPRLLRSVPSRPLPSVPRSEDAPVRSTRVERGERRRRRRWQAVAAGLAAAACLAVGVLVGTRLVDTGVQKPPNMVAMRAVDDGVPITAEVGLKPFVGGTQIDVHCVYSGGKQAPRWNLELMVYPKGGGEPQQVSTWTAAKGDDISFAATTGYAPSQIAKIEMRKGGTTPLLVYESA
jgi:hypothetical protein